MALSESRVAAADTRHRVAYPNSKPRRIIVAGLGMGGRSIVETVSAAAMVHVETLVLRGAPAASPNADDVLRSIAAGADELDRALAGADMVFVALTPADDASFAGAIASVARHRGVLLTGVIVDAQAGGPALRHDVLDEMRRACDMLVVTADADYLTGMLAALGN